MFRMQQIMKQRYLFIYSHMSYMRDDGIAATATAVTVLGSIMTIG